MTTLVNWIRAQAEICVDLDETIVDYDYYQKNKFGQLDPEALKVLKDQKAKGRKIIIFTARRSSEWPAMATHLKKLKVPFDGITNVKPGTCAAYLDNKGVSWKGNAKKSIQELDELVRSAK